MPIRGEELSRRVEALLAADADRTAAVPEVLGVQVEDVQPVDGGVQLTGYTPWDPVTLPQAVFVLIAQFDGQRTVAEALANAQAADPTVEAAWVELLFHRGILRDRDEDAGADWGFGGEDLTPEQLAAVLER